MVRCLWVLAVLLACLFGCKETPKPIADGRKADFAFYDANGDFHRLSRYNDSKAIVLYVQGNGCPIVRNGLADFHEIVKTYKESFTFFMLNANIQDGREVVRKEAKDFNFRRAGFRIRY